MKTTLSITVLLSAFALSLFADSRQSSSRYTLLSRVTTSKPVLARSGRYVVNATLGESRSGVARAGDYTVSADYTRVLRVVRTAGAPELGIRVEGNEMVVSWPVTADAEGWILLRAGSLGGPPTWSTIPRPYEIRSSRISVTLPLSAEDTFFRLQWR